MNNTNSPWADADANTLMGRLVYFLALVGARGRDRLGRQFLHQGRFDGFVDPATLWSDRSSRRLARLALRVLYDAGPVSPEGLPKHYLTTAQLDALYRLILRSEGTRQRGMVAPSVPLLGMDTRFGSASPVSWFVRAVAAGEQWVGARVAVQGLALPPRPRSLFKRILRARELHARGVPDTGTREDLVRRLVDRITADVLRDARRLPRTRRLDTDWTG